MLARARPMRDTIVAKPATYPAPVGGWNARDALDAMPKNMAETLINWFPETTYVRLRSGYTTHCDTGEAGKSIKSLMEWNGATSKLIAGVNGKWINVSSSTPATLATGYTSDIWDTTNFSTAAGTYMIACNGTDQPQSYDGTTVATPALTIGGIAPVIFFTQVEAYGQRLFFVEKDSLSVWYLAAGAIAGALTEFDFGSLCTKGGTIAAITTWTRDNGFGGANELFVVTTTKGEVLVYNGSDPGGATPWALAARYLIGQPVSGVRCVTRLGPDCILIGQDGFQPMAAYLQMGEAKANEIALSKNIGNAVTRAVQSAKDQFGWQAVLYSRSNMLVFNVPQSDGATFYQYVLNTITGAWCEWRGMNGLCWAEYATRLHFGDADGVVWRADSGASDNGNLITGEIRSAYQAPGSRVQKKRFTLARPVFQTNGRVLPTMAVDVDYVNSSITAPLTPSTTSTSQWGSFVWGQALWGGSLSLQASWQGVTGLGFAAAPHFKVSTSTCEINLMTIDLLYEAGAYI